MKAKGQWVIGIHAVSELLQQGPDTVGQVILQSERRDKRLDALRELARARGVEIKELDKAALDRRIPGRHQGAAALCYDSKRLLGEKDLEVLLKNSHREPILLMLDGVTDPRNLGACLRSADAAGVVAVLIPKDRSAPFNATVRKVASGAAETVSLVVVTNLARCLDNLKRQGFWIVGTDEGANKSLFEQDLTGPVALVMGSEGSGLRRLTREKCDYLVSIPMAGELSSLNVSVATGVALFEAVRQRTLKKPPQNERKQR